MPKAKDPDKAKAIHRAAMMLVIETGFSGLKMADVAKEAGMATGTLYIYYKSKDELINDIYLETKKEIIALLTNPNLVTETFYTAYRNRWFAYFNYCLKNPEKMLFVEQFLYSGYIEESIYNQVEELFKPLNQFLLDGQKNGLVKQLDIEILKAQMEGAIHEIIKMTVKRGKTLDAELKHECFNMAWDSVKQ
ncbi:TetR/AcrR family transcriptional regulator [Williamwhitmania taraxaci]|nr:TetR/AcrR family transcriptional regulator [Williamwhitmania taraxaci]